MIATMRKAHHMLSFSSGTEDQSEGGALESIGLPKHLLQVPAIREVHPRGVVHEEDESGRGRFRLRDIEELEPAAARHRGWLLLRRSLRQGVQLRCGDAAAALPAGREGLLQQGWKAW